MEVKIVKVSFEGIGESVVTFYNGAANKAAAGAPVKMSGNGEVSACGDGEKFLGVALACDAEFAAVQTEGYVEISFSGTAPAVGFVKLAADGVGGIKTADGGRELLLVSVDAVNKSVGFML